MAPRNGAPMDVAILRSRSSPDLDVQPRTPRPGPCLGPRCARSMIGEPQILGQVKDAFALAQACETIGPVLHTLFTQAFAVAKKVRGETEIARHAVSVSFAAVELAKKIFAGLRGRAVLLVGAGKMGELAARHLVEHGAFPI